MHSPIALASFNPIEVVIWILYFYMYFVKPLSQMEGCCVCVLRVVTDYLRFVLACKLYIKHVQ